MPGKSRVVEWTCEVHGVKELVQIRQLSRKRMCRQCWLEDQRKRWHERYSEKRKVERSLKRRGGGLIGKA